MLLGRHGDDGYVLLYERDRSVFKFARRVRFGMYVSDLFEFQRAFQRQRVVKPATDKEQRFGVYEL